MKKKLFLVALPLFMALSGCQAPRQSEQPQPENETPASQMSEDTLAHEEVFGGAEDTHALNFVKSPLRAPLTAASVKIGYQIQFDDKDTPANAADDTISIRFVAALKDSSVTAVWHRGFAQSNGSEGADVGGGKWKYKFSGEDYPVVLTSDEKYDALNNGGVRIAAGEGDYLGYECFVIYTLMNIPYETYKDSYLAAYVTLTGENTINSKGLAVKVERDGTASKNRFYFDAGTTGHFLEGTIEGTLRDGSDDSTHALLTATEHGSGAYVASYDDLSLELTDSFGSFYYGADGHFQFFGYNSFVKDTASPVFEAASLSEYNKPKLAETITIYISRDYLNKLFGSATTTQSVTCSTNYDAGSGNAVFIVGDMTNWGFSASYRLEYSEGNNWSGTFNIPLGSRVKYVVSNWDCSNSWSRWESGDGHIISSSTTSISVAGWQ